MPLIAATAVLSMMAVLALRFPPGAAALFAMTAGYADGFGISHALGAPTWFIVSMSALLLVAVARSALNVLSSGDASKAVGGVLKVALLGSTWIVFASLFKGASLIHAASSLTYSGLPFLVAWLSYATRPRHRRRGFEVFVAVQILLATLVLVTPWLDVINGTTYLRELGLTSTAAPSVVTLGIPDAATNKGELGHYAQFHNPNALGFYATAAMVVGIVQLTKRGRNRLIGVLLVATGIFAWLNSLTRGPFVGLVVGLIMIFVLPRRFAPRRSTRPQSMWAAPVGAIAVIVVIGWMANSGVLEYLLPSAENVSVTGRRGGYQAGLEAFSHHMFLGVPLDWQWTNYPHFLPLLYGALFGIVGGAVLAYLSMIRPTLEIIRMVSSRSAVRADRPDRRDLNYATLLFLIVLGIAATDNLTAPALLWFAVAEALMLSRCSRVATRKNMAPQLSRG